jgi:catechol 2,3-dioxygenase-like lactoylglutathione lyase family enzyme
MALKRLDNIGIVVDDLELTIDFFQELGLQLEGRATIEGRVAEVIFTEVGPSRPR